MLRFKIILLVPVTEGMVSFKAKEKEKEGTGLERKMTHLVLEMYREVSKLSKRKF